MSSYHVSPFYTILRKNLTFIYIYIYDTPLLDLPQLKTIYELFGNVHVTYMPFIYDKQSSWHWCRRAATETEFVHHLFEFVIRSIT
jgi:hypothetical protein